MNPTRDDIGNDIAEEITTGEHPPPTPARSYCPCCGASFARVRRQRYCTPACRQAAWRARHPGTIEDTPPPAPPRRRRANTVYTCDECDQRYLGEQWCPDCNRPARRVDLGGLCPHCDEPVAITDLTDQHRPPTSTDPTRT